jgi:hypothetical protein
MSCVAPAAQPPAWIIRSIVDWYVCNPLVCPLAVPSDHQCRDIAYAVETLAQMRLYNPAFVMPRCPASNAPVDVAYDEMIATLVRHRSNQMHAALGSVNRTVSIASEQLPLVAQLRTLSLELNNAAAATAAVAP